MQHFDISRIQLTQESDDDDEDTMEQFLAQQSQNKQLLEFLGTSCVLPPIPQSYQEMKQIQKAKAKKNRKENMDFEAMSDDELDELKQELLDKLDKIKKFKETKFRNQYYCQLCQTAPKTVAVLPCSHLVMCQSCEMKLKPKQCPRCLQCYNKTITLRR